MTEIIGLAVYILGAVAMWKLRQKINPDKLYAAAKNDPSAVTAVLFLSSVFWPITMPFMFIGWAQRKLWPPKTESRQSDCRRKPKSQRGKSQ